MTQDQVANLLGVSLRTYQSYEDNQDKLSWSQVKVLAKEFGVPVENIR